MKKIYLMLALSVGLFSSCFDDDGNYTYTNVDEITIEGLAESYIKNSFNEEVLEIDPVIKTNYTDLTYEWWMWNLDKEAQGSTNWDPTEEPYEAELISTEKKLVYPVECPIGRYALMLKVTSKSNGYFGLASTQFNAQTLFTRGFYILNETGDGNTELDLYNRDGIMMDDLLTATGQGAMKGRPLMLGVLQSHAMMNELNESQSIHSLCVTTEDKQIAYFNAENLEKVHDEKSIVTGGMNEGEVPYVSFTYGNSNFLLTSRGCNVAYIPDMMPTSGAIGIPAKTGGGSQFVMSDGNMAMIYWNKEQQRIDCADHLQFGDMYTYNENDFSTTGMECLMCGASQTDGKGYFLLKDTDGKQYLYEVLLPVLSGGNPKTNLRTEIPADSKLASATAYAVNATTTNMLYYVSGNQMYIYNLPNYTENPNPVTLPGIGADETLTYLSYQWQNYSNDTDYNFTYLVVGTQKGDDYKLYMYTLEAGIPKTLAQTIEGKGKLKMCAYMTPALFYDSNTREMGNNSLPN